MTVDPNATPEQQQQAQQQQQQQQAPPQPQGIVDPTGQGRTPMFIAWDQNDLNGKFGNTRQDGRLSLAKEHGFDTLDAFNAHMTASKAQAGELAAKTTAANEANGTIKALKLGHAAENIARDLGVPKENLADVLKFSEAASETRDLKEDGSVDTDELQRTLNTFLDQYPAFKQPKAPTTVGASAGTPAATAGAQLTLDEQIATAQKEGRLQDVIALQTQKMFSLPQ